MMTQKEMLYIVQSQLAIDLNCTIDDLKSEKDSIIYVKAKKRRYFEILSMGKSIVVSASPERLSIAKTQMQGKDKDTVFSLPFIRGIYLHYLPDLRIIKLVTPPDNFSFEMVEQDKVGDLINIKGFNNAIIYDTNHPRRTNLAVIAKKDGEIVGMAGASKTSAKLLQIGIDILPKFRNFGLAVYLVNSLTFKILERGYVPCYDAIASNLASQRVAHRAGYYPAWVSDWRCDFEGL